MRCPSLDQLPPPPPGRTGWPWTTSTIPHADLNRRWPRITIVTPSYNQGHFLEETIRSVLLQGYPDLEFLVVDGGSNDDSVEVIKKYAPWLSWWVSEKDRGQSHAINKGFARSTGAIHGYLASDDVLMPGALLNVADEMADSDGVVTTPWIVGQASYRQEGMEDQPLPSYPEKSFTEWFLYCPVPQPASFWSASLHQEVGPFREDLHYYFDYEFWMRLRFNKQLLVKVVDHPLAIYRLHAQSKTVSQNHLFAVEGAKIREDYLPRFSRLEKTRLWFAQRRWRARKCGASALTFAADRRPVAALGRFLLAVWLWPPVLLDSDGIRALRRRIAGRSSSDKASAFVWTYNDA